MKVLKKICIILAVIVSIIFINGCYFVFHGQFKAIEKIESGKDLNVYETFSAYTMHSACWMFGWISYPITAKLAFCSQFNITPSEKSQISKYIPSNAQIDSIKNKMCVGDTCKLTFKSYIDEASVLFNGSTISYEFCSDGWNTKENNWQSDRKLWKYTIPINYQPGIITINNIKIGETLFDYLENKGILHPFTWTLTELDVYK